MHWQKGPSPDLGEARLYRFAGAAAAGIVWMGFATAGWCWIQFVERLIELPAVAGVILEWSNEFLSPDSIARRALNRINRG